MSIKETKYNKSKISNPEMEYSTKLAAIALFISVITGLFGIFGGIPGIKSTFFSKPSLEVDGFMPIVVFDEGNSLRSQFPKFSLKGFLKVSNLNNYDISLSEMKLYGISRDTIGYKFDNGKTLIYGLSVPGIIDSDATIVRAYDTAYLKFNFAHFENTESIGAMKGPLNAGQTMEKDKADFQIFRPTYAQLFKHNQSRQPHHLVDEIAKDELNFAITFNNELIKIPSVKILDLYHCSQDEWVNNGGSIVSIYNAGKAWRKTRSSVSAY